MPYFQLGLIGYPLSHSLSPKLHLAALKACGLEGNYSLFPIAPDDLQGLKDLMTRVRRGEICGLNVTILHKQNIIQFLDELTPTAQAIRAVNTIYLMDKKLIGDNTDAPGFLADLRRFLTTERTEENKKAPVNSVLLSSPKGAKALVLGAGGSARAVVYALTQMEYSITVAARRIEQANELAVSRATRNPALSRSPELVEGAVEGTHHELHATDYALSNLNLSNISLVVNTTPVGMTPNMEQSPWPREIPFPKNAIIYDLVYNPRETLFVQQARAAGLKATTGLGMLIEQAALAFEIWTGRCPSREIMLNSISQTDN